MVKWILIAINGEMRGHHCHRSTVVKLSHTYWPHFIVREHEIVPLHIRTNGNCRCQNIYIYIIWQVGNTIGCGVGHCLWIKHALACFATCDNTRRQNGPTKNSTTKSSAFITHSVINWIGSFVHGKPTYNIDNNNNKKVENEWTTLSPKAAFIC